MVTIRETTADDLDNVKQLWADGDVMQFVGFPDGLHETAESMKCWYSQIAAAKPDTNHFSIFDGDIYCGEAYYSIDRAHGSSASLDIKLFQFARGKGIATVALGYTIEEAFKNGAERVWVDPNPENMKALALYERLGFVRKPMPAYLVDPQWSASLYMELTR